ncbi:MAG: protein-L-isoaspartate(D-aspartate) O-methyltransferase [bacterium]|nr:protein-L-isoaspartate(D-aspartate) O-methyltransferase [bacterium]
MLASNEELVEYLCRHGYISSERVRRAFLKVDRRDFVPPQYKKYAYLDEPLPIGKGQTISAPSVVAKTLELAEIEPGQKVLEIGTGSGYLTALLAELVGPQGLVVSVEYFPELAEFARKNLEKYGFKNVVLVCGDGSRGYPELAPYDRIVCGAAAPYPLPQPWIEQLKEGRILVSPVQYGPEQWMFKCIKAGNKLKVVERWGPVVFVPLRGEHGLR